VDSAAIAELYRQHVPALRGFTTMLTAGDRALAEDLVHDAFIRATSRVVPLRNADAFEAYLRRSVINAAVSWRRRQGVERRWLTRQAPGWHADAFAAVDAADRAARLLRALPPRQRVAVAARICLDLSEAQTAHLLGCSLGTVKSLTSRGLAALRKIEEVDVSP
jgi:RNA polymerase sigma factor (sigma-70 family)